MIGPFDVHGAVTMESTLQVTANTSLLSALSVGALATLNQLRVLTTTELDGNVTAGGSLSVAGAATLNSLTVTTTAQVNGNADVEGTLRVVGTVGLIGNVAVGGNLDVNGIFHAIGAGNTSTFDGGVTINGNSILHGSLAVTLDTVISGNVTLTSTLHVIGTVRGNTVSISAAGKTYAAPAIQQRPGAAFGTVFQNTSTMSRQVTVTGLINSTGGQVGSCTVLVGPTNPPVNTVWKNENTSSVANSEVNVGSFAVPPGWFYEIQVGGDFSGAVGRW